MSFIIRDKLTNINGVNPQYRGVFRPEPSYVDSQASRSDVNRAFETYLSQSDELGSFQSVEIPRQIVSAYNAGVGKDRFEVLETAVGIAQPTVASEFFGYDLACKLRLSHIAASVDRQIARGTARKCEHTARSFVMADLIVACFCPKLNRKRLFDDFATAVFCLEAIDAIQGLWPDFFENGEFEVLGLWGLSE